MDFCKQIENKPEWFSSANDALADLMTACRRTNEKGDLTVKIKVEPSFDKEGQTIATMRMEVKVNCPRPAPGIQSVYVITDSEDRAVELSKDHPAQMAMFAQMKAEMKEN